MKGTDVIRVYLVDDQALSRVGLRSVLEEDGRIEVVGECGDARIATEEIRRLVPDVVVLDLSGIEAFACIRSAAPSVRIVMLTHQEGDAFVQESLRTPAEGFLSKRSDPREFPLAIESVYRGDPYVSAQFSRGLVASIRRSGNGFGTPRSRFAVLTKREREVFELLEAGKTNREVAELLGVRLGTAKKHRENLQRKLRCECMSDASSPDPEARESDSSGNPTDRSRG